MSAVIKTETSALVLHDLDTEIVSLIEKCVKRVDPELDFHPEIILYGKVCHQQRSVGFFSDISEGYNYSGTLTPSKKMHKCLNKLLKYINETFECEFNGILINKYLGGEEYIGKHSDDERGLDSEVGVIALSYGAIRKFRIRDKLSNKIIMDVPTDPNKIIQMAGDFQKEFTHEIPVEKKVKEVRYSFTFRKHNY